MTVKSAIAVLLACAAVADARATPPSPAHPSRVLVKYRAGTEARAAGAATSDSLARLGRRFRVVRERALFASGGGAARTADNAARLDAVRVRFPDRAARAPRDAVAPDLSRVLVLDLGAGADPIEAAAAYARDPAVEWAEPDWVVHASYVPDDPYFASSGNVGSFPDLWGLHAVDAATAWDTARGDGVVVAVIDTGIKWTHPDLRGNVWTNPLETKNGIDDDGNGFVDDVYGWDFTIDRSKPKDRHGHGTHVAGTIAATGDNGVGVVGMAWRARVMGVRGLDRRGSGFASNLAQAMVYAAENGADILNNSWGGIGSAVIEAATDTALALGAVVIFSAGNDDSPFLGTAADPDVIAVSASEYGDGRASFSNFGQNVSVAAPGVSVLSLRGPGRVGGTTVGGKYRVLSGTSMAAPHAAGIAALLLSALPGLGVDEVRWHLELNADQPGYPGYEGQAWNPYFGFGRVNAARAFTVPPVTTRIRTPPFQLHGLAGAVTPAATTVDFSFTTHDPVAWTASGPPWLQPDVPAGTGDATVPLTLDGTGLSPATYTGDVTVTAPTTADGGASLPVTAHLHQDVRAGGEVEVSASVNSHGGRTALAGDGAGILVAWVEQPPGGWRLHAAYVTDAGAVTGPFTIDAGGCVQAACYTKNPDEVAVAFDGTNFLVVWNEHFDERIVGPLLPKYDRHHYVKAVRVTAGGEVLGAPVTLFDNLELNHPDGGFYAFLMDVGVGFDGTAYTVVWGRLDFLSTYEDATHFWMRRVGTDGAPLGPEVHVYPAADTTLPQIVHQRIACVTGSCLVAWHEADGERSPEGLFIDKLVGRRYVGTTPLDSPPFRIATNFESLDVIASDSTSEYLLGGYRQRWCPGPTLCGFDAIAARATAAGTGLDPDGIRLNQSAPTGYPHHIQPGGMTHDGTSWIATWTAVGGNDDEVPYCYPFAARIAADGSLLDAEPEGLLFGAGPVVRCGELSIARAATRSYTAWLAPASVPPTRLLMQGVF